MQKMLVKFECNWADEFNCEYFEIMSKEACDQLVEEIKTAIYPLEAGFGSNESFTFESPEEVLKCMRFQFLNPQEAKVFAKYFVNDSFGTGSIFHCFVEC